MRKPALNSAEPIDTVEAERKQLEPKLGSVLYAPDRFTEKASNSRRVAAQIRVLMVTTEWPINNSAPNQFIARQAAFLESSGVDVDVFHFRGAKNPLNYMRAWLRLRAKLARGNHNLIHAQFGQSGLLALPKRLPLVVTLRGDDIQGIVRDYEGRITRLGKLLQQVSKMVARYADAVIVVSEHMKTLLGKSIPAYVIPSGIDFNLFRCMPQDQARRHLRLSPDKRLVLFIGRTTEARKRYQLAKRAVEILNQSLPAELIVGWGLPHTEMPFLLNACDALVCTSLQEGSPNAVKEALACNLPVVSVGVADVPLRLRGISGCEVTADDRPETIAAALERVLSGGQRIEGRKAVKELDERLLTQKLISIYESILTNAETSNHRELSDRCVGISCS